MCIYRNPVSETVLSEVLKRGEVMNWYSHMMKSHEVARARNQRMERRQQFERYGPGFVTKTRIAALNHEKRMIERELERIRKGVHRPPKFVEPLQQKDGQILTIKAVPKPSFGLPSMEKHVDSNSIDPEYSSEENKLYDAILFLQNNPSALVPILTAHARSDAYFETLERISPRLTSDSKETTEKQTFVPRYLQERSSKGEKVELLNKYTSLLHRHSPDLRKNSPALKSVKLNITARDNKVNVPAIDILPDTARSGPLVLPPIGKGNVSQNSDVNDVVDGPARNLEQVRFFSYS